VTHVGLLYPQKTITLVHTGSTLIGEPFNPKLREKLLDRLQAMGVRVVLEERVLLDAMQSEDITQTRTYVTDSGTAIAADLLLICYGAKVNNRYLLSHFAKQFRSPRSGQSQFSDAG
jgi:NADH dehydrogenase FAD-containing subunit